MCRCILFNSMSKYVCVYESEYLCFYFLLCMYVSVFCFSECVWVCVSMFEYVYVSRFLLCVFVFIVSLSICVFVLRCVCVFVCVCVGVCVCMCVYGCVCVYVLKNDTIM